MKDFLNLNNNTFNNHIPNFKGEFLSEEEKYNKNKQELEYFVKSCSIKTNTDKEFYKALFKLMDNILNRMDEEVFNKLGVYINPKLLIKIVLFLKYKENLNYREKIKMLKKLAIDNNIELSELLFREKYVLSELNVLYERVNKSKKNDEHREIIKHQLLLFKNVILILKCVLFNFHKKELMYVENGTPKYKIGKIKTLYSFYDEIKLGYDVNINNLMLLFQKLNSNKKEPIYTIDSYIAGSVLFSYLKDDVICDDYNKFLLDKSYNNVINNRVNSYYDSTLIIFNSDMFKHRKVLIPKNGVIILVENEESSIESILLSEKEFLGFNNLYFVTKYKDGKEIINSIILNNDFSYSATILGYRSDSIEAPYHPVSYIIDLLGIDYSTSAKDLKYNVISPIYWKYRNNGYRSNNDKINNKGVVIKREFEIGIAPYLRQINGEPSKEALKLANKLGVILDKGYTIVKPHTRTYNKVK